MNGEHHRLRSENLAFDSALTYGTLKNLLRITRLIPSFFP